MKIKMMLAALMLSAGATTAVAQTSTDGATAGEKPGQGTNTGTMKDGKMMGPPPTESGTTGTSSGATGADMPANKQPGANGKGVTPNSNSGPAPK
ncbi:MAG: hypothetical protein Q7T86_01840 [Hyphomicrobiaceae bacterium]|nr:hypothetical protein [Hyphomicrobiaceae bacterium]